MTGQVSVQKEDKLAIVTIDNPPMNVLSQHIFAQLDDIFTKLATDNEVVAVIVTGAGNRAFVAGADIREFPDLMDNPNMKNIMLAGHQALNRIDHIGKPTIAALNGLTFGGGCELALACDIRIAEAHTQIGLPEVKLGLFPGGGGTQRLPRLVGEAKAKEIMFTGEPIDALQAKQIGLVNDVVPTGTGLEAAIKLAAKITRHSLQALSRIKQAVDEGLELSLASGIEREVDLFVEVFQTEDVHEGVQAFFEKRTPVFKHR